MVEVFENCLNDIFVQGEVMFNLDKKFVEDNMMGPNSLVILEELTRNSNLQEGKSPLRVLDLGCGMGLTSIYLATEFNAEVFAVDLWISATDNFNRFKGLKLDEQITPIHCEASQLPFADEYFDVVVSVDSYHYFGNNSTFFEERLKPLVKPNGEVLLAFPSMKENYIGNIPKEMAVFWEEEALQMWQSIDWWRDNFSGKLNDLSINEMSCYNKAWSDWLQTENPYAVGDRDMFNTDNGQYMNLISIKGRK